MRSKEDRGIIVGSLGWVWVTFIIDVCAGGAREKVRKMTMFKLSSPIHRGYYVMSTHARGLEDFRVALPQMLNDASSSPEPTTACNWTMPNYRSLSYFGLFLAHLPIY